MNTNLCFRAIALACGLLATLPAWAVDSENDAYQRYKSYGAADLASNNDIWRYISAYQPATIAEASWKLDVAIARLNIELKQRKELRTRLKNAIAEQEEEKRKLQADLDRLDEDIAKTSAVLESLRKYKPQS